MRQADTSFSSRSRASYSKTKSGSRSRPTDSAKSMHSATSAIGGNRGSLAERFCRAAFSIERSGNDPKSVVRVLVDYDSSHHFAFPSLGSPKIQVGRRR